MCKEQSICWSITNKFELVPGVGKSGTTAGAMEDTTANSVMLCNVWSSDQP